MLSDESRQSGEKTTLGPLENKTATVQNIRPQEHLASPECSCIQQTYCGEVSSHCLHRSNSEHVCASAPVAASLERQAQEGTHKETHWVEAGCDCHSWTICDPFIPGPPPLGQSLVAIPPDSGGQSDQTTYSGLHLKTGGGNSLVVQ